MYRAYNRRTQILGLLLLIGIILAMLFLIAKDLVVTRHYISTKAVVTKVTTEYGTGSKSNMMQFRKAYFRYTANGQSFESGRTTFFMDDKSVGKTKAIRYDPNDPTRLQNTAFLGAEVVLLLACALSVVAVKRSM